MLLWSIATICYWARARQRGELRESRIRGRKLKGMGFILFWRVHSARSILAPSPTTQIKLLPMSTPLFSSQPAPKTKWPNKSKANKEPPEESQRRRRPMLNTEISNPLIWSITLKRETTSSIWLPTLISIRKEFSIPMKEKEKPKLKLIWERDWYRSRAIVREAKRGPVEVTKLQRLSTKRKREFLAYWMSSKNSQIKTQSHLPCSIWSETNLKKLPRIPRKRWQFQN